MIRCKLSKLQLRVLLENAERCFPSDLVKDWLSEQRDNSNFATFEWHKSHINGGVLVIISNHYSGDTLTTYKELKEYLKKEKLLCLKQRY